MLYQLQLQEFAFKEINIHVYVPERAQVQSVYKQQRDINDATPFPYWAKIWPAAYALSNFIIEHNHFVKNKNVAELAAGLALPSFVAAKYAAIVCCSDHSADAIEVVQQSVLYNRCTNIKATVFDWQKLPVDFSADVVLLSDINYAPEIFDALYNMLLLFLKKGITVILSTPQRLMAKTFIGRILPFVIQQENIVVPDNDTIVTIAVFVLK
ncbi:hypothetical protein FRZ67_05280 [Panacibacter ginsenosidivorans]|uniref:Methyltransferase n=1 Tax=Panacibacter ginsenosidivorans TaxID=1813871 RepID=A0A5B8V764_9BACT|nr:hypothetical protein [Panacibacter ginsenosidivorans]QEC66743.1 hypothetical protein FRZ67_05280 [Panacibacter ginsenosidivorans]